MVNVLDTLQEKGGNNSVFLEDPLPHNRLPTIMMVDDNWHLPTYNIIN